MQEQREGREVLFPTALRDGLAGPIPEAVSKALLAGTRWPGAGWFGFLNAFDRRQMHRILFEREI